MRDYILIFLTALVLVGCSGNSHSGDILSAHHTVEKVKDGWLKMSRPLEIEVTGRTKAELEAIGSLAVWLDDMDGGKAMEFRFDGKVFKPSVPVMADSTALPLVCYPFLPSLQPADTVAVRHPIGEKLTGQIQSVTQTNEKTKITMKLEELTALLRLILKSDNISDVMQILEIRGDCVATTGFLIPLKGRLDGRRSDTNRVCSVLSNCLLNNGIPHDFNLIPTEGSGEIRITIKVNGKNLSISTTLPPLRRGSITELRLHVSEGKLSIGSSWVDSTHSFENPSVAASDSVKSGYFLQKDGTISPNLDENSLAWIIKTDGRHGKAVALDDNSTCNRFGKRSFHTGHVFETTDGKLREGYFGQPQEEEDHIVFSPRIKYPGSCALGFDDGAALTQAILRNASDHALKNFQDKRVLPTAYIPSLAEMAQLAYHLEMYKDSLPPLFKMPEGTYATSCESGADTFYSIDMSGWFITAYNSKEYNETKTRLFYLF
ncbi:hypothetical protein [uncultured Bacteroides sp.]|uniref:hypothetical protein n=1 Tax=uncultured Bacteroides sp. TaxID=162156 RepID=UPI0025992E6A|nr:hypothetical protein [uncultured Bacteroides sp.]